MSAETMLDAAAVVLASYPDEVMNSVTHPVTGLPGRLKWPPNIAEIRQACEIAVAPIRAQEERDRAIQEQLRRREEDDAYVSQLPPRDNRLSYDELKAKYGDNWGIKPPIDPVKAKAASFYHSDRSLTHDERQAMYAKRFGTKPTTEAAA